MNVGRLSGLASVIALMGACAEENETATPSAAPDKVFQLPKALNEISGLAIASNTSVFAHNDEHGIVYEINTENGAISRAFAFGDPTVSGDFEGIAVSDGRIYLLTSNGRIYEAPIGEHGERVIFNVYDTGLRDRCEFEGLANAETPGEFLLLCKRSAKDLPKRAINIYRWSAADKLPLDELSMSISLKGALSENQADAFRPSAIERRDDGGLIIISAANAMLLEVSADGEISRSALLGKNTHQQAEGVAISSAGDIIIADEGARRGHGKVSIYKDRP